MEKLNLSYLTSNSAKSYSFFLVPDELTENPAFDDVDYGAKMLYGKMLSRASLSAKNPDYIDENGNVYIIYTVEQVMEKMRCSTPTAVKMLKQLDDKGLIEKIRRGQGKPSIIYVKDFSTVDSSELKDVKFKNSNKLNSKIEKDLKSRTKKGLVQDFKDVKSNHINHNHINQIQINHSHIDSIGSAEPVDNSNKHSENAFDSDLRFADKNDNPNLDYQSYIKHLNFDNLNIKYINKHKELQTIRNLIFQTLTSGERTFRIGRKDVAAYQVKDALRSLTEKHLDYVLNNSLKNQSEIKRYEPYLLTSLYNASKISFDNAIDVDSVRNAVKNNIYLDSLLARNEFKRKEIFEIFDILVEVLVSHKKSFRIAKGELPAPIVKQAFANITDQHIEYVLENLRKNTSQVKSVKSFLQTCLYNSTQTINNHLSIDVNNWLYQHLGIQHQ